MLLRAVSESLVQLDLSGRHVLVAVSGGVDSVALLHALHVLSEPYDLKVSVVHVNHGLRGAESEADEQLVAERASQYGLAFEARAVAPERLREGGSSRERPSLQEAARTLRYRAFEEVAVELAADVIATGHQLDDQAETVLLRLFRGSGPEGLQGIPERSPDGRIVRPLLQLSRAEIEGFATEHRLRWREDASNQSPAYSRNRLRALLPGLAEQFNPQILRAIGNVAEALRRDGEWISTAVDREISTRFVEHEGWIAIDGKDWASLPPALARRVAREALVRSGAGRDVSRVHLERICRFLGSDVTGKRIELPGGLVLERRRGGFRLGQGVASDPRDPC